jgi:hypothetical protein
MSGIIQSAKSKYLGLGMREYPQAVEQPSELPTLADLLLPGTGYKFSDEFACLLTLLGEERKPA